MDWLSGWLKSIILVILLATFVDLLLPNHSMQRYVKTVMSLFLLLALLQPLLTLFNKQWQVNEVLAGVLFKQNADKNRNIGAGEAEIASLSSIRQSTEALRSRQEEQSNRIVQNQAADLMKRKIEQTAGVKVRSVQVVTEPDTKGAAVIKQVSLSIDAETPNEPSETKQNGQISNIEPIKPVTTVAEVDIGISRSAEDAVPVSRMKEQTKEVYPPQIEQKRTQIMLLLEQDWQLSPEQIRLEIKPKEVNLWEKDRSG